MSIKMMVQVWTSDTTSGSDRLVLLALADSANDDGYCWPSMQTIAKKANLSKRYVVDILDKLEKAGEIEIAHRFKDQKYTSNMYRVVNSTSLPSEVEFTTPSDVCLTTPSEAGITRVVRPASLKPSINRNNNNHKEESTNNNGASADVVVVSPFELYESEKFGPVTEKIKDHLNMLIDEFSELWVSDSLAIASLANKRNLAYTEGILKNWKANGKGSKAPGKNGSKPGDGNYRKYLEGESAEFFTND